MFVRGDTLMPAWAACRSVQEVAEEVAQKVKIDRLRD
jgi:hypothetical protein